jgi:HAD superfamily hydrolase (TIGR01549 family)
MAISSISNFYSFSLYIFDLDNTLYKEEDYLYQAYAAIADKFAALIPSYNKEQLFLIMKEIFENQGRENLFNKFLTSVNCDSSYLSECLDILRSFEPENPIEINKYVKPILPDLINRNKNIFVLTNGNADQQKNKIKHIKWDGLDSHIHFVFAEEIEPKPSPAGVLYILKISGIEKNNTVFVGDSETDKVCAMKSGVNYLNVNSLSVLDQ